MNCPHCGWTLGVDTMTRCANCGRRTDKPRRDPNARSALGEWWFRFTHRGFRRACVAGRGHLVEAHFSGSEDFAAGNVLLSRIHLRVSAQTDGTPAWEGFCREERHCLVQLRCRVCAHAYVLQVGSIPLGRGARGYVAVWDTPWCRVWVPTYGQADEMRCPNCGGVGAPAVRILDPARFQGASLF